MSEETLERRFPFIAMGVAVAALVIALIAVVVVIERGGHVSDKPPEARTVAATDVVELQGSGIKIVPDKGMQITDTQLARKLGLAADDVITAISGRAIKREFDVHEAMFNTSMMKATTLYIELERDGAPMLVRWNVDGDLLAARHAVPPTAAFGSIGSMVPDAPADPLLDTIEKVDDTHVTIPRATFDAMYGDPMKLSHGVRFVPAVKAGRPDGIKLYSIRPGSVYAKLGFENGDAIEAINGVEMSSPDKALELYTKARSASELVVEITRRGMPMTLTITVK